MRDTKYTKNAKRVKPVTCMPGWMLKMKGFLDSFKGESVCDKYLERLHKKLASQAGNEDIAAENDLFLLRKEASFLVLKFREQQKKMGAIPADKSGDSVEVIRENRRNGAAYRAARAEMQETVQQMTDIDETINHIETIRNIRIARMESLKEEKIAAYVSGVRCGKIKKYAPPESRYDDTARHLCREKHDALEQQMQLVLKGMEA